MYDKIVNPLTGRYVSVKGTIGKIVLKNYLKQLGGRYGFRSTRNFSILSWKVRC